MYKQFKEKLIQYRFILYILIILLFAYYNLSTYDLYVISRNPMIFFRTNWFEIVSIILLFAIYYQVTKNKNDE